MKLMELFSKYCTKIFFDFHEYSSNNRFHIMFHSIYGIIVNAKIYFSCLTLQNYLYRIFLVFPDDDDAIPHKSTFLREINRLYLYKTLNILSSRYDA